MMLAITRTVLALAAFSAAALAQQVIPLYPGTAPGSEEVNYPEKQYFSKNWNTEVVTNVTKPSLTIYKPAQGTANGTAIVICPGGGFMALSINSEGIDVAKWLSERGVTAFVLKYRLAHTGEDATQEFATLFHDRNREDFEKMINPTVRLAISDGHAAIAYVRQHAGKWGVNPDRIGIIGFSAGGTVTTGAALHYTPDSRPTFAAPIYPAAKGLLTFPVPADAPPLFIAAASDDNLGLAPDSVALYNKWLDAHKSVELHMYAKGGHGFGMRKTGLPTEYWIDRFGDWLQMQGWLKK